MAQQVSDSELTLMKILWSAGGSAKYAAIMEELAKSGNTWQKNTVITLLSRLVEKGLLTQRGRDIALTEWGMDVSNRVFSEFLLDG